MLLLEWALRVFLATLILLLLALFLAFIFDILMTLFHGPQLGFVDMAFITAIVSVGSWPFSLLRRPTP